MLISECMVLVLEDFEVVIWVHVECLLKLDSELTSKSSSVLFHACCA